MARNFRHLTLEEIYRRLRTGTPPCDRRRADNLAALFAVAGKYLVAKIEHEGWRWRDNYMREHAGCALGASFSNTYSPLINELVFRAHPEVARYEDDNGPELFND